MQGSFWGFAGLSQFKLFMLAVGLCACALGGLGMQGCNAYDAGLLKAKPTHKPTADDGGLAGSGALGDGGVAGSGESGSGQGGSSGAGGSGSTTAGCKPNPDVDHAADCPMICTETCNNKDDDCDGKVDEQETDSTLCKLEHANASCQKGKCVVIDCNDNYRDCDNKPANGCESPETDIKNCGMCGKVCSAKNGVVECIKGVCKRTGCLPFWGDCDKNASDCETDETTLENCAGCGFLCEKSDHATPSCELGFCGPGECAPDFGDCNTTPGDGCEQDLKNSKYCGSCDKKCDFTGSSDDCSTGVCVAIACEPGFDDCDGNSANGCESLSTATHCGGCDKVCNSTLMHVSKATCNPKAGAPSSCAITCADGYADCDGDAQTGCETQLGTNSNCTKCDDGCVVAHGKGVCEANKCVLKPTGCDVGYGDCTAADGCETQTNTLSNCGMCGTTCNKASCASGTCSAADCSMAPHNGDCGGSKCGNCDSNDADCETKLTDVNNCGACGNKCTPNAGVTLNGTLLCAATGCSVTCSQGFADCNGNYRDGCETPINTLSNCDACGQTCAIANASAKCTTFSGGHYQCQVATCNTDFGDCDTDGKSCESALNTPAHCKTCGTVCNLTNAMEACTGGTGNWACSIAACDQSYFRNCDNMAPNGCEIDVRSNTANCGACGTNCATQANVASASCANSSCSYTCAAGFKDCNSSPGCETNTKTLTDCGGCGVACSKQNAQAECSTGTCNMVPNTCSAGFADCVNGGSDGCETPLKTTTNCTGCGAACGVVNGVGSCSTGACVKASCNSGWDDCDGNALDCERNVTPPASGGQGPCLPDTNCIKKTNGGHDYYFCSNTRDWNTARAQCQTQLLGDLVRIDDQTEDDFVRTNVGADSWIGGNDVATEGKWFWAGSPPVQFWNGNASGAAVGGLFTKWNGGEPNDSGGAEDCAHLIMSSGLWNDAGCTTAMRFVCEVQSDQCPSDPAKTNPGQCGCGVADTDSDNDLTANCNDGCPNDAAKVAPGACGCGTADTDSDADGVPDCKDKCPGAPDVDTDGDGVADCADGCPYDSTHSAAASTCSYSYTPSNYDPTGIAAGAPDVNVNCNVTLSSSTSVAAVNICGASVTPVLRNQTSGPQLWILPMKSLTVASGFTLKLNGSLPVVLSVAGDATINGTIDAGSIGGTTIGAGGNISCAAGSGQGADASHDGDGDDGDGGGGGGAFGANAGGGGKGNGGSNGGGAGAATGNATLVPLRGGCRGGKGGNTAAGAGGGAVEISIGGKLTLAASGVVTAAGGGGAKGGTDEDGGGGGGSGGAILLEAFVLNINGSAWITANGGGGAGGNSTNSTSANPGTDGQKTSTSAAPFGAGAGADSNNDSDGGNGGQGGALGGGAAGGSNAGNSSCVIPVILCGADGGGGGGGGGSVGRVRIHGATAGCSVPTSRVSPASSTSCP